MSSPHRRTFGFTVVNDVVIVVHGEHPPPDPEWDRLLDAVFAFHSAGKIARVLVFSLGGAPTAAQRHRMDQRVRTSLLPNVSVPRARIAILGQSTFVRAVINASVALEEGWFGGVARSLRGEGESSRVYRAFAPHELKPAIGWLSIAPADVGPIEHAMDKLRQEVTANSR